MTNIGKKKWQRLPDKILAELAAIGLTRATDVLRIENGTVELKAPGEMKKSQGAAIAAVEKTAAGVKIKFYDKLKALELLGSYLGIFGDGGLRREENNLLEAILSSTGEELDTSDLQELQQAANFGDDLVESSAASGV